MANCDIGTVSPSTSGIVARWYGEALAVINDTASSQSISLHFNQPLPPGKELTDVVTGRQILTAGQANRQDFSFTVEAYSLNTFSSAPEVQCAPPPLGTYRGDLDGDRDVDANDLSLFLNCVTGPEKGPVAPGCELANFDCDDDIDQSDFATFQRCLSGEGFRADVYCD